MLFDERFDVRGPEVVRPGRLRKCQRDEQNGHQAAPRQKCSKFSDDYSLLVAHSAALFFNKGVRTGFDMCSALDAKESDFIQGRETRLAHSSEDATGAVRLAQKGDLF